MTALAKQLNLYFCNLRTLASKTVKHEDAFRSPADHKREFEKQKIEHIYEILKAEKEAELANTHEPDEIKESLMLQDEYLRKKAWIIAGDVFSS